MPIYLAPIIGTGTKLDKRRPAGTDGASASGISWSAVELVNNYMMLYADGTLTDASLIDLGQNPTDIVPNNIKNQLNNRLGIDVSLYDTLYDVVIAVMNSPNLPWVLRPNSNGKKEFHLGPISWTEP